MKVLVFSHCPLDHLGDVENGCAGCPGMPGVGGCPAVFVEYEMAEAQLARMVQPDRDTKQ